MTATFSPFYGESRQGDEGQRDTQSAILYSNRPTAFCSAIDHSRGISRSISPSLSPLP